MRWDDSHESPDVIDRRGDGPARPAANLGGLLYLLPWLLRTPFGWVILLGGVIFYVARAVFFSAPGTQRAHDARVPASSASVDDKEAHIVASMLDEIQGTWTAEFARGVLVYPHAKLVLYTNSTRTACGFGEAASGPFYCPADQRVYLDLGFFHELSGRLGAHGQFAQAYVIAHEVGHHVQKVLKITEKSGALYRTGELGTSVRLELQADCFAGIWAHLTQQRDLLEDGDIDSALSAAAAVGDDRLQREATGTVHPESWTHGSSAERSRWFTQGYKVGTIAGCDTFKATHL
jgi:hypothetical protein